MSSPLLLIGIDKFVSVQTGDPAVPDRTAAIELDIDEGTCTWVVVPVVKCEWRLSMVETTTMLLALAVGRTDIENAHHIFGSQLEYAVHLYANERVNSTRKLIPGLDPGEVIQWMAENGR